MKIDGACHCGGISIEADVDPANVVICHCTDCQTFSGAPYRVSVPVLAANFTLRGEPSIYVKTADSGNRRALAFCGTCGTALYSTSPDDPQVFNLRVGFVNQRTQLPPMAQGFCGSAMPWATDISAVREIPRASAPRATAG
jgi:hypothetical protein